MISSRIDRYITDFYIDSVSSVLQLSTQLLQQGRHEDVDRVMAEKEKEHQRALEAAEADIDAEIEEHANQITQGVMEEHTSQLKEGHKQLLLDVSTT